MLTEREKEIALQVAHRAAKKYRHKADEPYSFDDGCMIHAFDLFLSSIREEQEAVAYVIETDHPERKGERALRISISEEVASDSGAKKIMPLFTTPPDAPCDCEELVEALERVLKWVAPIAGDNSDGLAAAEEDASMTYAYAALINHKSKMKGVSK